MALIDPQSDALVIRVVYDGPPLAGKTTSLKTLAGQLGRSLHTPAEVQGRTVYFDWLDYTGGVFEGRRIRCQIVSVPGQDTLARRRRRLLRSADAIVFVADSTLASMGRTARHLKELRSVLAGIGAPGVGIVMQANKRDCASAVRLDAMRRVLQLDEPPVAVVESVATDGAGTREAFVFAVRLALDRVRELTRLGALVTARPQIDSPDDLLSDLRRAELVEAGASGESGASLCQVLATQEAYQPAARADGKPCLPAGPLPSGMIWPPVEGRALLHGIAFDAFALRQDAQGHWIGEDGEGQWCVQSPAEAQFTHLDEGRAALLAWARSQGPRAQQTAQCCIALAGDGAGRYRLWQCVRTAGAGAHLMAYPPAQETCINR